MEAVHASRLITSDRNLSGRIQLAGQLAILVGENNTGKSNVIDACRILFEAEPDPRARRGTTDEDFAHDASGNRMTDAFELEAELRDLDEGEQARMVTCLAPSLGAGCARLRVRARLRADGRVDTEWVGGDCDRPDLEHWAREAATFTYLHPLRDAAADLRPGRENPLVALLGALAPGAHPDRATIEEITTLANEHGLAGPA
jgi:putative ATP-dependent endonuclease of OLD family